MAAGLEFFFSAQNKEPGKKEFDEVYGRETLIG